MVTMNPERQWAAQEPDEMMTCEHCGADAFYTGTKGTGIFEGAVWTRCYRCPKCGEQSTQSLIVRDN